LEHIISRLRIQSLKGQVEASREHCNALANQFASAQTSLEKTQIAKRYDEAMKQTHAMQLLLEMLERQQQGAADEAGLQREAASRV
jgi:hypothetical protein